MPVNLPLDDMSIEEKIRTMETIWDDLCSRADSVPLPQWHEEVLIEREKRLKREEDEFIDWEAAKANIRNDIA